jgi:hypothetical protein
MDIDKALNQAPMGLDALELDEPDFEIEIDLEEDREAAEEEDEARDAEFGVNLAEDMDDDVRDAGAAGDTDDEEEDGAPGWSR